MSEKFNNPSEGQEDEGEEFSPEERCQGYLEMHPEAEVPAESIRDCVKEVVAFEGMIARYESHFNLEELFAITDLTHAEAEVHPVREPARKALAPIISALKILKAETNIPEKLHDALVAEYKRLSHAVGIINKNKVDHTR